jgi:hypothetical protein
MDKLFEVHMLNEEGKMKARLISEAFDKLLVTLKSLCSEGREWDILELKLEEASFFAKKAMASLPNNQEIKKDA